MGTKQNPGAFDCYANAAPDEPMFVLLARDPHAAVLVNLWAAMRRMDPNANPDKIMEAEKNANEMVAWLQMKRPDAEVHGVQALAAGLCVLAEMVGAVVTISQEPLEPLTMGNHRHALSVRPTKAAREAHEKELAALMGNLGVAGTEAVKP